MKTRKGLVSNSSSSSFIISISNNLDVCEACGRSKGITQLELTDRLNSESDYDSELYNSDFTSKDFMDELGCYWDEEDAKRVSEIIDNKQDTERIMYLSVDYSSEWLFDKIKSAENINIIYGESE